LYGYARNFFERSVLDESEARDLKYSPRSGGDAPKNAFDMILAETVPNAKEITLERA
jgi:hypothetical protein